MAKPNALDGKRLKLISIDDKHTDLKPGDLGTVDHVDDLGQIHMKWDNGGTLALIPELDRYEIIEESDKHSRRKLMLFESFSLNNDMDTLEVGISTIRKMVSASGFIKMKYESERTYYTSTLDIYFEDGDNTQGNIYTIDLGESSVIKAPYVKSSKAGDYDEEDDINESNFQTVNEIVTYLINEVADYIKIEEKKKQQKGKRV